MGLEETLEVEERNEGHAAQLRRARAAGARPQGAAHVSRRGGAEGGGVEVWWRIGVPVRGHFSV